MSIANLLEQNNYDIIGHTISPDRLTTTQRNNIIAVNGMISYDSTLNLFFVYQNGQWTQIGTGSNIVINPAYARATLTSSKTITGDATAQVIGPFTPAFGTSDFTINNDGTITVNRNMKINISFTALCTLPGTATISDFIVNCRVNNTVVAVNQITLGNTVAPGVGVYTFIISVIANVAVDDVIDFTMTQDTTNNVSVLLNDTAFNIYQIGN